MENGSGDNRPRRDGVKELYTRVCAPVSVEMKREKARLIKSTWGGAGLTLATAEKSLDNPRGRNVSDTPGLIFVQDVGSHLCSLDTIKTHKSQFPRCHHWHER